MSIKFEGCWPQVGKSAGRIYKSNSATTGSRKLVVEAAECIRRRVTWLWCACVVLPLMLSGIVNWLERTIEGNIWRGLIINDV